MNDKDIVLNVRRLLATLLDDLDTIRVEVEQGIVYLEGVVASAAQKQQIQQIIGRLPEVRQVVNCLSLEHIAPLHPHVDEPPFDLPLSNVELYVGGYETYGPN